MKIKSLMLGMALVLTLPALGRDRSKQETCFAFDSDGGNYSARAETCSRSCELALQKCKARARKGGACLVNNPCYDRENQKRIGESRR
jgi:hypothetical protein